MAHELVVLREVAVLRRTPARKRLQAVADKLIKEHHGHLNGVTVTCVSINKVPTSKGWQVWARAKKISGLPAFLVLAEQIGDLAER